jgi:hypothetical protein
VVFFWPLLSFPDFELGNATANWFRYRNVAQFISLHMQLPTPDGAAEAHALVRTITNAVDIAATPDYSADVQ